MLKRTFLLLLLLFPVLANSQDIIENFKQLSSQQLFDTANYYYRKSAVDTALLCYSLLINTPVKDADSKQLKRIIEAYNRTGVLYCQMSNYRGAYEFLIKALLLCEKYNIAEEPKIYTNLGNIYYRFNKYDIAKLYYAKALNLCEDSIGMVVILNNIGSVELENKKIDSAAYFLNEALQISKRYNNAFLDGILGSLASLYQETKHYDSAFYYFHLSLDVAKKNHKIGNIAEILSYKGKLYFEINKMDSALFYINLSNTIAEENNFLAVLVENHLTLSKMEESQGRMTSAFKQFKKYVNLKDSVFNVGKFSEINQLQRLYEVSKTNQQIEQLAIEQQIKERTIYYQRIIQFITLVVLLLVCIVLLVVFSQKRKLNTAYKVLFEKNLKIIELQENTSEKHIKRTLPDNIQNELLNKIIAFMENTSIICDPKFTVNKLAELVQSNQIYVSQVINTVLKKNFRSLLNSYRIREAQRLLSVQDTAKYTVGSISLQVGFKSQTSFHNAFKEITGVTPNFYLKSLQKLNN